MDIPWLYNGMCKVLNENAVDSVEAYMSDEPAGLKLRENLFILEALDQKMDQILLPVRDDQKQGVLKQGPSSTAGAELGTENLNTTESCLQRSPSDGATVVSFSAIGAGPVSSSNCAVDAVAVLGKEDEGAGEPGVIVLED